MVKSKLLQQAEQIRPGDHMVILYEDEKEITEHLSAYIHASLERNERCIYITGDTDTGGILRELASLQDDEGTGNGDFVILDRDEAYSRDGRFEPDRMIELIRSSTREALDDGYNGLSVTGEISWVLDYEDGRERIIEYEWKLNEQVFDHLPVSALCRYNLTKFSHEMIINIIQLHPFLIWNGQIHENPFHIPPEGYKNNEIARYQVQVWLENIGRFSDTKSRFRETMEKKERELEALHRTMTEGIVRAMVELLSVHDHSTNRHSDNAADLAKRFALHIGLSEEEAAQAYYGGLVHDIGKTLVPREILNKPGLLTAEEYEVIKRHPVDGANALAHVSDLAAIADGVRYHHERWDGKGYPAGLVGDQTPLLARILSIVDAFEAMTNDRPYRSALTRVEALAEIRRCAGTQFDPDLAVHFVEMPDR